MSYQPIENYGVIGDLNTIALVGIDGSIDFLCLPDFDSPTVFAALLDKNKGGKFQITAQFDKVKHKQLYLPDTNVLLTRFLSQDGVAEITDFMPVEELFEGHELIRRVTTIKGEVKFSMRCMPRFNYARGSHKAKRISDKEINFYGQGSDENFLRLKSSVPLELVRGDAYAEFTLAANETADFMLEYTHEEEFKNKDFKKFVTQSLFRTVNFWKDWISRSGYSGRWLEMVHRSALVLKMLTSYRYGSIIAAPTFGLPEGFGGRRNWDYRYTWIRDASFTIYSLMRLGFTKEAGDFMNWLEKYCCDIVEQRRIGIMYSIDGKDSLPEKSLRHLEGYKKSSPVRIGNKAHKQLQLDIYGELFDAVYLYNKYGELISYDFWKNLVKQLDWLSLNWEQPDDGIWEVRASRKKFLYSRLQVWVAFDRALKIARQRSFPVDKKWERTRDKVFESIFYEFWDEKKQAFMQFSGSQTVDASCLLMPLIRFIGPKDPRWLSTLRRVEKELVYDSLVYRYNPKKAAPDGFVGREGTFSVCTFWYVECLARSGSIDKAQFYFEKMLGYANHLGLYSEQLGFQGEHLGNFPQALTHMGLISAAYALNEQLNNSRSKNSEEV